MWNKDEARGKGEQVKGRAKEAIGGLSHDDRMRSEGEAEEASGRVQESFGKGRRKVGESIEDFGKNLKK